MRTRITRPTLAELWRVLLATLEDRGAEGAAALARDLAVSVLIGRTAESKGVRVERRGEDVVVTDHGDARPHSRQTPWLTARLPRRRRAPRPPDGALTPLP